MTTPTDLAPAWNHAEFEAKLRERGRSYHIHHPFNVMLNGGRATPEQIRGWVFIEDRVGVVDVDQQPARLRRQSIEPLDHAARTGLRQVADVACRFA